jgi:hypothetical protein
MSVSSSHPSKPYTKLPTVPEPRNQQYPTVGPSSSNGRNHGGYPSATMKREVEDITTEEEGEGKTGREKRRRVKRSSGKACVYCRRRWVATEQDVLASSNASLSHMVCEGGRPCERWYVGLLSSFQPELRTAPCSVKREISHLCRDVTPPIEHNPPNTAQAARRRSNHTVSTASPPPLPPAPEQTVPLKLLSQPNNVDPARTQLPTSLYADPNFPPAWPLLPDTSGPVAYGDLNGVDMGREGSGSGTWGMAGEDTELGALTWVAQLPSPFLSTDIVMLMECDCSKFLGDLGVPSLPGGFLDVLSYFGRGGTGSNMSGVPIPGIGNGEDTNHENTAPLVAGTNVAAPDKSVKGKGKEVATGPSQLSGVSRR